MAQPAVLNGQFLDLFPGLIRARVRRTGRCDPSTSRMFSSFSAATYLMRGRPQPRSCFFLSRRFSSVRSATASFSAAASARSSFTSGTRRLPRGVAGQAPFAGLEELLRPAVVQALRDPLTPAVLRDAVLAAQPGEDDPDLFLRRILLPRRKPTARAAFSM